MNKQYPLLDQIDKPSDLRELNFEQLPQAADELREFLIDNISQCGGHFGSAEALLERVAELFGQVHCEAKLIFRSGQVDGELVRARRGSARLLRAG